MKLYSQHESFESLFKMYKLVQKLDYDCGKIKITRGGSHIWNLWVDKLPTKGANGGKKYEWVEIFGMSRHRKLQGETLEDTMRIYPNHLFIKIEVV